MRHSAQTRSWKALIKACILVRIYRVFGWDDDQDSFNRAFRSARGTVDPEIDLEF